jgi:hypothetical protein
VSDRQSATQIAIPATEYRNLQVAAYRAHQEDLDRLHASSGERGYGLNEVFCRCGQGTSTAMSNLCRRLHQYVPEDA